LKIKELGGAAEQKMGRSAVTVYGVFKELEEPVWLAREAKINHLMDLAKYL
jgi:hypothetical protein